MPDSLLIDVGGIALRRPSALVLRDVSLRLEPGEAVGLLGANGSGKSTLLRILATLLPPTAGEGSVLGARLGSPEAIRVRTRIALIGHDSGLHPHLTLGENLAMVATLAGRSPADATGVLDMVGLGGAADRRVAQCSNGMRRRADFARLFLTEPTLALLDEAHVGLDEDAAPLVEHLVAEVGARGGGVVLVSHQRDRILGMTSRRLALIDGVLVGDRS